jgi:hypothetical protein
MRLRSGKASYYLCQQRGYHATRILHEKIIIWIVLVCSQNEYLSIYIEIFSGAKLSLPIPSSLDSLPFRAKESN